MRGIGLLRRRPATVTIGVFLVLWYSIQYLIAPKIGFHPGTDSWYVLFALSADLSNPHGLVTSMLSHSSPSHLGLNLWVFLFAAGYLETRKTWGEIVGAFVTLGVLTTLSYSLGATLFNYTGWGMGASGIAYGFAGGMIVDLFTAVGGVPQSRTELLSVFLVYGSGIPFLLRPPTLLLMDGAVIDGVAVFPHLIGMLIGLAWIGAELHLARGQTVFEYLATQKQTANSCCD